MYQHLTLKERYQIWSFFESGKSRTQIAREIGRSVSTISRELNRNKSPGKNYDPEKAEELAKERKQNAHKHERFTEKMKKIVEEKIKTGWSPEQVSGYCKKHKVDMVSYETIYQHIRVDKENGGMLYKCLRHAKKRRKKYGAEEKRGQIKNKRSIDERPVIVDQKKRVGDWEADTIIGHNHRGCIVTLVERKTKLTLMANSKNKKAENVKNCIIRLLEPFKNVSHTITFDNGKEFAKHEEIEKQLGIKTYFAHAYSSYERGLNENTNGLIRQYLPKKTDLRNVPDFFLASIVRDLNTRPRKTLDFASPIEAFAEMRL
jgi:IS30 family transposase